MVHVSTGNYSKSTFFTKRQPKQKMCLPIFIMYLLNLFVLYIQFYCLIWQYINNTIVWYCNCNAMGYCICAEKLNMFLYNLYQLIIVRNSFFLFMFTGYVSPYAQPLHSPHTLFSYLRCLFLFILIYSIYFYLVFFFVIIILFIVMGNSFI